MMLLLLSILFVMLGGCSGESAVNADGGDVDTDTDADADTDADTDSDSETDSDTETDTCLHPEVAENCTDGWCEIPPGCFLYGSPPTQICRSAYSEEQVYITLTRTFEISSTEVTQAQWEELGFPNPSPTPHCADCPVSMVNWFESLAYCNALSVSKGLETCYDLSCCEGVVGESVEDFMNDGFNCTCNVERFADVYACPGYRLPTVAEWEYATRAGTTTATYNGESMSDEIEDCAPDPVVDEIGWSCSNATHAMAVGILKKNRWGLYDTLGNLTEWCSDPYYNTAYGGNSDHLVDPYGFVEISQFRPVRGGLGGYAADPSCLRSARNLGILVTDGIGFRPVRTILE